MGKGHRLRQFLVGEVPGEGTHSEALPRQIHRVRAVEHGHFQPLHVPRRSQKLRLCPFNRHRSCCLQRRCARQGGGEVVEPSVPRGRSNSNPYRWGSGPHRWTQGPGWRWAWGQPRVLVQVVGGVHLHVRAGDGALVVRQGIEQRCVDLQQAVSALAVAGSLQTVVDDGGDVSLVGAVRLLLDQGGDGDDLRRLRPDASTCSIRLSSMRLTKLRSRRFSASSGLCPT